MYSSLHISRLGYVSPISKVSLSDLLLGKICSIVFIMSSKKIQSLVLDHLYLVRDSTGQFIAPSTIVRTAKAKDELFIHAKLPP